MKPCTTEQPRPSLNGDHVVVVHEVGTLALSGLGSLGLHVHNANLGVSENRGP